MTRQPDQLWHSVFRQPFTGLSIGKPDHAAGETIHHLSLNLEKLGGKPKDKDLARCCIGALWLKADFFDEAHNIFQDLKSQTGSLWHGISHRREKDYSNAGYWYSRCGNHPAAHQMANKIPGELAGPFIDKLKFTPNWDFNKLNSIIQDNIRNNSCLIQLMALQEFEWCQVFQWTINSALGMDVLIA